jgi:AraC-like DNA-binding protein
MKRCILPFDWCIGPEGRNIYSIGDDFILFENRAVTSVFHDSFELDVAVAIVCLGGTVKGSINTQSFEIHGPGLMIVLPDRIIGNGSSFEDFSGLFIIMSKQFVNDLKVNIKDTLSFTLSLRQKPWVPLDESGLNAVVRHFHMLKESIRLTENPYRMEAVKYMTISFFYSMGFHFHLFEVKGKKSKQTAILVEKFLYLVQRHYREQRELNFYAEKLFLTPKHLSKVVREASNKSANDWINDHVILEAKSLLRSSGLTIQQISEELNFPSQSFFGKYFKRCTGMSPSGYKKA